MTCSSCALIIKDAFKDIVNENKISINHITGETTIESENEIDSNKLRDALKRYPKYQIETLPLNQNKSTWINTYKPVLLLFFYIPGLSLIVSYNTVTFDFHTAMNTFMAGFFIAFSFFKFKSICR